MMCKCHEESFNCNQGRDCPARMPVQFAGDEPSPIIGLILAALSGGLITSVVFLIAIYGRMMGGTW